MKKNILPIAALLYLFFGFGSIAYTQISNKGKNILLKPTVTSVIFTSGSLYVPPSSVPNTNDNPIGRFNLRCSSTVYNLTSATITFAGTNSNITSVKLWSSTNTSFDGGAAQIGTSQAYAVTVTFSGLASPMANSPGTYYFVTLDLGSSSGTVSATIANTTDIVTTAGVGNISFSPAPPSPLSSTAQPLPVEFTTFSAIIRGREVELAWKTSTEVNNAGFEVEKRAMDNGKLTIDNWKKIGFVEGSGTTNAPREYSFIEKNLSAGNYSYRLKQIDRDGKFEYSNTVEATVGLTAEDFTLTQNFPNPFNPNTTIKFAMKSAEHVNVTVYNALGQAVATLFNNIANPNQLYTLNFDGKNLSGGTYFYALRSTSRNEVRKMLMLK